MLRDYFVFKIVLCFFSENVLHTYDETEHLFTSKQNV